MYTVSHKTGEVSVVSTVAVVYSYTMGRSVITAVAAMSETVVTCVSVEVTVVKEVLVLVKVLTLTVVVTVLVELEVVVIVGTGSKEDVITTVLVV